MMVFSCNSTFSYEYVSLAVRYGDDKTNERVALNIVLVARPQREIDPNVESSSSVCTKYTHESVE